MIKIEIKEEALAPLRQAVEKYRKMTSHKVRRYQERLATFEKRHGMDSETFATKFEAGLLGDEAEWFEWIYLVEVHRELAAQLKGLDEIEL